MENDQNINKRPTSNKNVQRGKKVGRLFERWEYTWHQGTTQKVWKTAWEESIELSGLNQWTRYNAVPKS